jgi:cysteinyl-tRNA synthetase
VQFDSPWGKGRPGWHIECSAMSKAILGDTLDIHGGGLDLQFPHHENELAQSESATDQPFARVWMHNGLLKMGSAKMAGSVGNVVNIADLLQRHSAETVRFLLLSTHYRSPIEYSEERLDEVKRSLQRFYAFFERYERITGHSFYTLPTRAVDPAEIAGETTFGGKVGELHARYFECMDDDFNTGGAVGVLFELLSVLNKFADNRGADDPSKIGGHVRDALRAGATILRTQGDILGLFWESPTSATLGGGDQLVSGLMQLLLDLRANLRDTAKSAAKDNPLKKSLFDQTDLIRKRLADLGVTLEDRPGGTTWRVG